MATAETGSKRKRPDAPTPNGEPAGGPAEGEAEEWSAEAARQWALGRSQTWTPPGVSATEWRWDPTLQEWYEGVIEHAAELDAFNFESWKARSAEWARGEIVREEMWRQGQVDSHDLWIRFEQFLSKTFRRTLRNAANTYLLVTALSTLMFLTGLGLFVFAAWYGSQEGNDKAYAVLFGGMGAATFVTLMVIQPLDRAQSALSNLMQAELCFMTTFQQIRLWQAYPYDQEGRLDPARMEAATTNIERLTRDAMALLERYLEPPPQKPPTRRRAAGLEKDGSGSDPGRVNGSSGRREGAGAGDSPGCPAG